MVWDPKNAPKCSFCDSYPNERLMVIAGSGVNICSDCVDHFAEIVRDIREGTPKERVRRFVEALKETEVR